MCHHMRAWWRRHRRKPAHEPGRVKWISLAEAHEMFPDVADDYADLFEPVLAKWPEHDEAALRAVANRLDGNGK